MHDVVACSFSIFLPGGGWVEGQGFGDHDHLSLRVSETDLSRASTGEVVFHRIGGDPNTPCDPNIYGIIWS